MKKLLLSFAAAVFCVSAAFADATIVIKDQSVFNGGGATMPAPATWTNGDFTFNLAKNEGTTAPAYNKAGDLRLYYQNTIEIKATNAMTSIVFDISANGLKRLTDITASTGTIATQSAGDNTVTWTGNASNVTFTVTGEKAVYGTETTKAGQLCFTQINIIGGGTTGGDVPPTPQEPNYTKASAVESGSAYVFVASDKYNVLFNRDYGYMSVTDVPAGTTDSFHGDETAAMTFTAVDGGYTITTTGGKSLGAKTGFNTFDTTADSEANRVWTVSFATDGTATIVNVATGKTVAQNPQYGSFGCYDADALEGKVMPCMFKLEGSVPPPPPVTTATFDLASAVESGADYVMVVDGKLGEAISASSSYGRLNLVDVAISNNQLVSDVKNAITITSEGSGYTMKDANGRYLGFDGEHKTSFQLYTEVNEFTIWNIAYTNGQAVITLEAAGVTGQVGVTKNATSGEWYNNIAPSVDATDIMFPTLYKKSGDSGVEAVVVDENAPVEYYNLQGIRVANPENGLFIRRQGNSVSKVYIR